MAADQIEWSCEDDIAPDSKLPGDVMVIILTYLPVKSLLKFKAVSKPWCSFISSPRFTKLHLHRQSLVAPNCLMLLFSDDDDSVSKHVVLNVSHNYDTPADDDVLTLENPRFRFTIIDSCKGLVCLSNSTNPSMASDLILWNPATKTHRTLDLPDKDRMIFGTLCICYVDATNDFKILVWNCDYFRSPVVHLCVYSLSSDSWENVHVDNHKTEIHFFQNPTFMGQCMHWLANKCPSTALECGCGHNLSSEIVAFDVTDKAMSWFHLPVHCVHRSKRVIGILVIRGCLSIVSTDTGVNLDRFDVWVMEEYGVEGSWVKRFSIQEEEFTRVLPPMKSWNNDEIVFINNRVVSKVVVFFDLYSGKKRYVEFSSYCVKKVFNHVESLASVCTGLRGGGGLDSCDEEEASVGTSSGDGLDSCGEEEDCYEGDFGKMLLKLRTPRCYATTLGIVMGIVMLRLWKKS